MHYFLTGEIQTGKSTVIRRLVDTLDLNAGGFKTKWTGISGARKLVLMPFSADIASYTDRNIAAVEENGSIVARTDVFDEMGPRILEQRDGYDVIIMDEIGFLESRSLAFQNAVTETLDGNIPVLGVIQRRSIPFLNSIRARSDIILITVTEKNRDDVLARLVELGIFGKYRG